MRRAARPSERGGSRGQDFQDRLVRISHLNDDSTHPPIETSSVDDIAAWQERRLKVLLSTSQSPAEAELVRVHQRIYGLVQEVRRILPRASAYVTADVERRLKELLAQDPAAATVESAWMVADSLKQTLPQIGDDSYLGVLMERELARDRNRAHIRWSNYFPAEELEALLTAFRRGAVTDSQRDRAVEALLLLWDKRRDEGAHYRTRVAMKARSFAHYAFLLGGLAVALGVFLVLVDDTSLWAILAAATAGALGATISGARRVRNVVAVTELRSLRGWKVLQLLVGASAGLFTFMVLSSDILRLPGTSGETTSWAAFATYGFIAGFAEPFFLGVVANLAGGGTEVPRSRSLPNK
jgi:hypothetical protein